MSHGDTCSATAFFALADLKTLERSQQLVAPRAATDKDVRREKTRHESFVHLRGDDG